MSVIGSLPYQLVLELRDHLGLARAFETGMYRGGTTRVLSPWFDQVVTVELSEPFVAEAQDWLSDFPNIMALHANSPHALREHHRPSEATLYWLDAHWSGGDTAGADNPCPVLAELEALGGGNPNDCVLIDDAREFATGANDGTWPSLVKLLDAIRAALPDHYVTSIHDLVIAVPASARSIVDAWARGGYDPLITAAEEARLRGWGKGARASHGLRGRIARLAIRR